MNGSSPEESSEAVPLVVALETSTRPASIAARGPVSALRDRSGRDATRVTCSAPSKSSWPRSVPRSDLGLVLAASGPAATPGSGSAPPLRWAHARRAGGVLGIPSFDAIAVDGLAPGECGAVLRKPGGTCTSRPTSTRIRMSSPHRRSACGQARRSSGSPHPRAAGRRGREGARSAPPSWRSADRARAGRAHPGA